MTPRPGARWGEEGRFVRVRPAMAPPEARFGPLLFASGSPVSKLTSWRSFWGGAPFSSPRTICGDV